MSENKKGNSDSKINTSDKNEDKEPLELTDKDVTNLNSYMQNLGSRSGKLLSITVALFVSLSGIVIDLLRDDGLIDSVVYEYIIVSFVLLLVSVYRSGRAYHMLGFYIPSDINDTSDLGINIKDIINELYKSYINIIFSIIFFIFFLLAEQAYVVNIETENLKLSFDALDSNVYRVLYFVYLCVSSGLLYLFIHSKDVGFKDSNKAFLISSTLLFSFYVIFVLF